MKRILLLFSLFISVEAFAPRTFALCIVRAESVNMYDHLIQAVVQVESHGDQWALNVKEQATGAFQIRPCRVDHFNRLTGKHYTTADMFDYKKAREVFLCFAVWYGKDFETISRNWNGAGKMTDDYWQRVKEKL